MLYIFGPIYMYSFGSKKEHFFATRPESECFMDLHMLANTRHSSSFSFSIRSFVPP
jgi:hypothetical protein